MDTTRCDICGIPCDTLEHWVGHNIRNHTDSIVIDYVVDQDVRIAELEAALRKAITMCDGGPNIDTYWRADAIALLGGKHDNG